MEDAVMKNKSKSAVWILVMLCAGTVLSQTKPVITIGGSLWNAKSSFEGKAYEGMKADAGNWVGPYFNIRMGKLLLGTSMYFGTIPLKSSSDDGEGFSIDLSRSDLNFSLGYSLFNNLNAFFAVKNAKIKGDKEFTGEVLLGYDDYGYPVTLPYEGKINLENKGTLFGGGLSTTYRFPQSPIFLFGSFALLKGTMNSTFNMTIDGENAFPPQENDNSVTLKSFNAGVGFQTGSGISILIGYRGENSSGEGEGQEKVNGVMATLAYTLR
jgi:opacity protein-like surface antigen